MMSGAVNSLWISSSAKRTPVSGAWNAADIPAAAPQVTSRRSSPLFLRRARETAFPDMPPSWTDGPSRPSESPARASIAPSANFAGKTLRQGASMRSTTSASICGMPEPEVAGSQTMRAETQARRTARTANHAAMSSGLPAAAPVTRRRSRSAFERTRR